MMVMVTMISRMETVVTMTAMVVTAGITLTVMTAV